MFHQVERRIGMLKLLDLNAAVGFWNMMARNLKGLQIDLESDRTHERGEVRLAIQFREVTATPESLTQQSSAPLFAPEWFAEQFH